VRPPRALLLGLLLAVTLDVGASACVRLPQDGPVRSVAAQDDAGDESLYDFTPSGPLPGLERVPLVDNFLTSMTATPLSTYVAREFLTASSSRSWVPERGTVVYGTQQLVNGPNGTVVLRLHDVVELDSRGTWRGDPTGGRGRDYRLRLVKENGEWRIQNPPDRLVIPRAHFDARYEQYLLYFPEQSGQVLVPEPVYAPRDRQTPTLLVAGLLKGPEPALQATERTFFPKGSALDGISVPVSRDGTAEVPLNHQVLDADDKQLNLVYAQLAWTLGQVPGVKRLQVTVDGTPVDVPHSRDDVGVDGFTEFDPSVAWASSALFGLRDGRVVTLGSGGEDRISGAFGTLPLGLRSIAVDLLGQHVAGVSGDGSRVVESDRDGVPGRPATRDDVGTVYAGGVDVARPVYDLYGQLWLVDRAASGARLSVVRAGTARTIDAPGISGADVTTFSLSRDGTRLVALVRRGGRDVVLVSRVRRDVKGRVLGVGAPHRLDLGRTTGRVRDIAWRTPASLAVLVAPTPDSSQVEVVKVDGSSSAANLSTDPELFRARATRLVTAPARGTPLFVETRDDRLYSLSRNGRWRRSVIEPGLRSPTFVG
jgi:hypothetical protein